ncbi:conserved phage C-terminal domain-containing protein [Megasphaera paucivorans]|uniref:Phage conserved hypothetical protein C-terminal domain-containing protein n=1 Tax=Megasphaera paucivorans TaxID=349095 RepID=A0A1G9QFN7_9FIRM|nr:conserved phage C-terminal domain-containing protein [Megasphaera paucivorans]SDM09317.1 phage conserved hypothetical protein, C-terminal domain-containing protein [Megasphaera paucivorans]
MSTKIRVEKVKNFTILSNKLLQDKRLSFKAKGLLAFMLSLPPDWDYSIEGLAYCSKDGKNSIRTALNELKECGYLVMERARDDKGRLDGTEYIIREEPEQPILENQTQAPMSEKPTLENPIVEKPTLENRTQQNTNIQNTNITNNKNNIYIKGECDTPDSSKSKVIEQVEEVCGIENHHGEITEIIDYLNDKVGTRYKPNTPLTVKLIRSRMKEGFAVSDFKFVIDKKVADWAGDCKMSKYLRPETLFSNKFEGYLNQVSTGKEDSKQAAIDVVNELYDEMGEQNGN